VAELRVGRKVGRTIYQQHGAEPSDGDPLVGVMDTPELATLVVEAVNREPLLGDLVAAVRRDFEHHDRPDGSAEWLNRGLELRRAARAALAAFDEILRTAADGPEGT